MKKKTYSVNVHMDIVYSVDVEAFDEDEAIELAEEMAEDADLSECDCVGMESCVTNED